jgi:hypothetical protein
MDDCIRWLIIRLTIRGIEVVHRATKPGKWREGAVECGQPTVSPSYSGRQREDNKQKQIPTPFVSVSSLVQMAESKSKSNGSEGVRTYPREHQIHSLYLK